jgi:hypothetical protein
MRVPTTPALLLALPLWIWWAVAGGGYATQDWAAGLWWLAGVAVLLAWVGRASPPSRPARVALLAAFALVAWSALSVIWAADQGAAWEAAERRALYALAFALPVLWPPTRWSLDAALVAFGLLGPLAFASGVVTALGDAGSLLDGRLAEPTGYPNADAALFVAAALVASANAAHADPRQTLRRAGSLAVGVVGLAGMLLTQSRGGLAATAVAALILLAAFPRPGRLLVAYVIAGGIFAALVPTLLDVRPAALDGSPAHALRVAVAVTAAGGLLAALAGAVWSAVARRRPERAGPPRGPAALRRRPVWIGAALVLVLVVGLAERHWVADRVRDFRTPNYARLEAQDSRFDSGLGSNRYDYWRVALDLGLEHPVLGSGAQNFHAPYLVRRRSNRSPLYAHQAWLEAFATLGAPGLAALLAFALAAGVGLYDAARRIGGDRELLLAAAIPAGVLALWASWDWVDYVPLVAVPALGLLGGAIGMRPEAAPEGGRTHLAPLVALGATLAALVAVPLSASARLVDDAERAFGGPDAPGLAARAGRWDPLGPVPPEAEGAAWVLAGAPGRGVLAYREALARDESLWFAHLELGLLLARRPGARAEARRHLQRSRALNPRDPEPRLALSRFVAGRLPPDPAVVARRVLHR